VLAVEEFLAYAGSRLAAAKQNQEESVIGHPVPVSGKPSTWMRRTVHISGQIEPLFGTLDENVRLLEESLRVRTHLHDTRLTIEGEQEGVDQAVKIVEEYNHLTRHGRKLSSTEVKSLIHVATEEPHESPRGMFEHARTRAFGKKTVTPKNASQKRYMEEIEKHDMMFAVGPGGTGKTYIAVAMAVSALLTKQVNRIILARPAVEAGERLGFLPGTLQEKVDPYMRPLYDALYDMLEPDKLDRFLEKGIIEVAPLAFMRGRTLNDSFVILDEAQNTTSEQMKMFLTRLGFNSKAVITGDVTQIDLPPGKKSGLVEALEICGRIEGIGVEQFNEKDVVRHSLVQRIIRAYEEYDGTQPPGGGSVANGKPDARHAEPVRESSKEIQRG
jgi:phosphate starvation-inducible protein PhoH and related proteins